MLRRHGSKSRRWLALAASLGLIAGLFGAAPIAGASGDADGTGYVILELKSQAAAHAVTPANGRFDPNSNAYANYQRHLENEHAAVRGDLGRAAEEARIVSEYFITANAVAVELNGADPNDLRRLSSVKEVHEVSLVTMNMDQSVGLINAPAAWAQVGGQENAGDGVRVGVIDSGIGPVYGAPAGGFFDCKDVEFGGIFVSGNTGISSAPNPGRNPGELALTSDHGTHVAGTVGGCVTTIADGSIWDGTTLSGVAPGATLVDYNVFVGWGAGWVAFGGSAFSHDIADAIEASVANGDHVINMSLGGGVQGPNDFLAQVSDAAVAAGVVVVTSAGNAGPGPFTIGSPASAADVISVGATTNTRGVSASMTVPGFADIKTYSGEFPDFDPAIDYTLIDWPGSDNLACASDVADGTLSGEVVLIERGACTFTQKVTNAENAGAGGVVVFTDSRDPGGMAKSAGDATTIPAVMIGRQDGLDLEVALAGGPLAPVTFNPPTITPETPNELAGFSSRGPTPFTGIVKPDVVAPGVNILSSVFVGFELFNGTSMASPHVAGASAVLLQAHPDWTPAQVKSALATTATDLGLAPWEQGSGLIDVDAAMNTNAFFAPTNASFGVFTGRAPANGSVDISVDSAATCTVESVTGPYADASLSGDMLTVEFNGGREAPGGNHGGYVTVDCDGQDHTIPWGVVVNR